MPRRRPAAALVHRLLAAVLLLQTVLAPALCLARGAPEAAGPAVEICTADGLRTLHGAGAPDGADDGPEAAAHRGFCLACHALPQAAALPAPALPRPAWAPAARGWSPALPATLPPGIRGPPGGARAPPALLS